MNKFQTPQSQHRQRLQQAKQKRVERVATIQAAKMIFENKHPVSLLGELCAKRKFGPPFYEVVEEGGPFHHRHFLFKVRGYKISATSIFLLIFFCEFHFRLM